MASESPSSKKEPPWLSILPPMPRISVSTNARARLSHRRPALAPPTPSPPAAVLAQSPDSTDKSSESPVLEAFPVFSPKYIDEASESAMSKSLPAFSPKSSTKFSESTLLETIPDPPSWGSPTRTAPACEGEGEGSRSICTSSPGLDRGETARPGNVCSLSNVDPCRNSSSVCAFSELINPSGESISANGSQSAISIPIARIHGAFASPQACSSKDGDSGVHEKSVGFGMDLVFDGLNEANDLDIGGLSRDKCTSSSMGYTVAVTSSSAGSLDRLEEVDLYGGAWNRLNRENCSDVHDEGDGGIEAKDRDFGRSCKDDCTFSDMEITIAESTSSPGCHTVLEKVDGCKGGGIWVKDENYPRCGHESDIPDVVNEEELVLNEVELEEGQLPGEWSGGEESHEDAEPADMLEDSAAVCPIVREVPTIPMTVGNQGYHPFQVGGIHSEQRSGGNNKAKGKRKKKHKKGEGSKKRSLEKCKEKYNEVAKKRMAERKGLDGGPNSGGLRNSKGSSCHGDQTGNKNGTGKFNEVPENVPQTLPKKATVDEGPEDGEILIESTKTNEGILSSLVEAEVGLWTTDDVDDQFVAEMEQDGAVKRKRGPETAERKLKRKIAKRKKRAQKERELGIRRPPRTVQCKPVKVLCTHYMKGRCSKGDQCTFSHDAVPLTKQEPCKFLMSHSCLKGDDCPYSHDLRAFPCKFFHTRGLCYDGDNCQFSHGTISEEALAKLKQRVEKEKKERISSISALDIPTPSFSTPLPPDLDPDPLGWGTPSSYPSHEERMHSTNPTLLDQSARLYVSLENDASVPSATAMPCQSIGFSTATDRKDTEFEAFSPQRIGEEAGEYEYMQFSNTKALQSEKSIDLRKSKSDELSENMGLAATEGPYSSTMPKILKGPACSNERGDAGPVPEVLWMEGNINPGESLRLEPFTCSKEPGPQDALSGPPSLVSPRLARTVPLLRGRQLGSLVLGNEKVLQSRLQTEPKRQHTVDSLLDAALRQ